MHKYVSRTHDARGHVTASNATLFQGYCVSSSFERELSFLDDRGRRERKANHLNVHEAYAVVACLDGLARCSGKKERHGLRLSCVPVLSFVSSVTATSGCVPYGISATFPPSLENEKLIHTLEKIKEPLSTLPSSAHLPELTTSLQSQHGSRATRIVLSEASLERSPVCICICSSTPQHYNPTHARNFAALVSILTHLLPPKIQFRSPCKCAAFKRRTNNSSSKQAHLGSCANQTHCISSCGSTLDPFVG